MNPQVQDDTIQNLTQNISDDIAKAKIRSYLDLAEYIEILRQQLTAGQISYEDAKRQIDEAKLRFDANINGL